MAENSKGKIGIGDIALVVVSAVFLVGVLTVFGACGPNEEGGWMTCHWAGMSVAGIAAVLVVLSVVHLVVRDAKMKMGIDIAIIPMAALAAVTPGFLIGLCMMSMMQCHTVMRPAVIAMSILMVVAAVFDFVRQRKADTPKMPR